MGYLKIENLYRWPQILTDFGTEVYALEKIDGTSAHISWNGKELKFFGGCVPHESFKALFNQEELIKKFAAATQIFQAPITIYGEAYGGKIQKMSETYGPNLCFTAFDIKHGETWLDVPSAANIVADFGLSFVDWERGPSTVEWVNSKRDQDSTQAIRNGIGPGKIREGVIIRPLVEQTRRYSRVIAKHKRPEFCENKKPREINLEKLKAAEDAREIADDWVTEQRLFGHVIPKMDPPVTDLKDTPRVIAAILADIKAESEGEIIWSDAVHRAIGNTAAKLWKKHVTELKQDKVNG